MTVETTNSTISYTGNNSVTTFAYNFLTYSEDHLFIYLDDVEQTSGFSIDGVGDESGGSVIFDVAPGNGVEIRIDRTVPETQLIEYQDYGPFKAKTNERGLDLGVMIAQQNAREIGRDSSKKMDKRTAAPENNVVIFDDEGNSKDSGATIDSINVTATDRVVPFGTLNEAVNESNPLKAFNGALAYLEERTSGNGGGGHWSFVLASTVTPNTFNVVQCVGVPTLALVLKQEAEEDPRRWGALFDNSTDIGTTINFMLLNGVVTSLPNDPAAIETTVNIQTNSTIIFNGSRLRPKNESVIMFKADNVSDWSLLGSATFTGNASSGTADETGIEITGFCLNYRIENIHMTLMKGWGFRWVFDGDFAATNRSEHALINNCNVTSSVVGWDIGTDSSFIGDVYSPGAPSLSGGTNMEFLVLTGCSASGNVNGVVCATGNMTWSGGNVVDNGEGVQLFFGNNSNHGIFDGLNINHNGTNIRCVNVANGYTFDGCNMYGDSASLGKVVLDNSQKVNIKGGMMSSVVECLNGAGTLTGSNVIANTYNPSNVATITGDDSAKKRLRAYGNYSFLINGLDPNLNIGKNIIEVEGGVGFANSWVDSDAGSSPAGFYLDDDGALCLMGRIKNGTINSSAFTLPVGYRPRYDSSHVVVADQYPSNTTATIIVFGGTGVVFVASSSNTEINLDGVRILLQTYV